jgi:hypothetical protein
MQLGTPELVWLFAVPKPAAALGISLLPDSMTLVTANQNQLVDIEFYAYKTSQLLKACPRADDFEDQVNQMGSATYRADVEMTLHLASRAAQIAGFDPAEFTAKQKTCELFPITKNDPLLAKMFQPGGLLATTDFLRSLKASADPGTRLRAEIAEFFYHSLPWDKNPPMLAVARAFVSLEKKKLARGKHHAG